jgi:hypothetical protein
VTRFVAFLTLITVVSIAAALGAACGGSGGALAGGSCYTATDCAPGLYCFGVNDAGGAGMCTSNANKAAPPGDAAFPDGGNTPMPDGPITKDSSMPGKDSAPPADTGMPPMDTGTPPMDTGTPPMDTGTAG